MARLPVLSVSRYLLEGQLSSKGCLFACRARGKALDVRQYKLRCCRRALHATTSTEPSLRAASLVIPNTTRKTIKDEVKRRKASEKKSESKPTNQTIPGWELSVGVEIHAQLNTPRKLFSPAATSSAGQPNRHVAGVDVSLPGAQPVFQKEALIPALRAALALNCEVQLVSKFDRKHYFWWDQPAGYQITQYYEPFARNGYLTLLARDGIAEQDGKELKVRIKQIQMEQDTGKTISQPGDVQWLDFNRVGMPLIEIITEPDMHHPRTVAAFVKKIQTLLATMDACVSGMEMGGLRADINVSVRRDGDLGTPLGTRTEIKNLGSIKAVEDAIIAERDRQISELEAGETIVGETRGWTIGSKETRRLRGKEGEVDYRYMPDPDLQPLYISDQLVDHLRRYLPTTSDVEVDQLISVFGLTPKDALSLVALEGGARVEYFYRVVEGLGKHLGQNLLDGAHLNSSIKSKQSMAANWILHELGKLTMQKGDENNLLSISPEGECAEVPADDLAELLFLLCKNKITGKVAKQLLVAIYVGEVKEAGGLRKTIDAHDLWFHELSEQEYGELANMVLQGEEKILAEFSACGDGDRYPQGKLMWLVGKMMKAGATERINAQKAEGILRDKIGTLCKPAA